VISNRRIFKNIQQYAVVEPPLRINRATFTQGESLLYFLSTIKAHKYGDLLHHILITEIIVLMCHIKCHILLS